jgi:hypothetical protein
MRVNPHTPITDYTFAAYDCAQLQISAIMQAVHDAKEASRTALKFSMPWPTSPSKA